MTTDDKVVSLHTPLYVLRSFLEECLSDTARKIDLAQVGLIDKLSPLETLGVAVLQANGYVSETGSKDKKENTL